MSAISRRVGAVLVAAFVAVTGTAQAAPATTAPASSQGNDFSWPQCPKGVGNGQGAPLPAGHRTFEIVGLTDGRGLHENPCLARQWAYAVGHADHVTAYTVPTYPTRLQRAQARTGHYGRCHHLACRLRNNGWAQGRFAAQSLLRIQARPPMVWVDVETRYQQPWSGSRWRNSLVVHAEIASLEHLGYRVGLYSTSYMWQHIAGYASSLPEWVPGGDARRGCWMPFSHGPVWMSQFTHYDKKAHAAFDESGLCSRAPALHRMFQPT